jgi:hypothetical protein
MPLKVSEYGKFKTIPIELPANVLQIVTLLSKTKYDSAFVAGGAVRAIYNKEPIRDLDIFSHNRDTFNSAKGILLEQKFIQLFENPTLTKFVKYTDEKKVELEIDLVAPRVGEHLLTVGPPESVIAHFDFTVSRAAITSENTALVDENFETHCKEKKLSIAHIVCPLSTVQRIGKYVSKGYTICTKEIVKLFIEYGKRDTQELEHLLSKDNLEGEELARLLQYVYVD